MFSSIFLPLSKIKFQPRCHANAFSPHCRKFFKGTHVLMREVEVCQAPEMTFRPAQSKVLTPDGEIIGQAPISVSVLSGKLKVFDS